MEDVCPGGERLHNKKGGILKKRDSTSANFCIQKKRWLGKPVKKDKSGTSRKGMN